MYLLLSLLFPYYSLVAHNISLVAPFYVIFYVSRSYHRSFHSLFSYLFSFLFIAFLVYRSSLISFALLFISLSFIAHFIRSSLYFYYRSFYRSSLLSRSSLCSSLLLLSFIAHFIRSSLYFFLISERTTKHK